MSQQDLAERSGLSVRTLSDLERGRTRFPYRDSLARLADALGLRGPARTDFIAAAGRRLERAEAANAAGGGENEPSGSGRIVLRQSPPTAIEQLAHALHAKPVPNPRDLGADIWESDAELAAFLAGLRAARTAPLG
jgi:transcriptional regulator with XRE-family HTH domain